MYKSVACYSLAMLLAINTNVYANSLSKKDYLLTGSVSLDVKIDKNTNFQLNNSRNNTSNVNPTIPAIPDPNSPGKYKPDPRYVPAGCVANPSGSVPCGTTIVLTCPQPTGKVSYTLKCPTATP